METAVYGLFSDPHAAQGAFEALRDSAAELGFEARHIISISSEPFDEFEFGARESKTPMPWLAALGGLAGAAGGFGLTALTQEAYPLPTGGMPIVAHWTNAIIIYEMAMLGAVLAILLALLVGARLPDLTTQLYDREVSSGKILIGVTGQADNSRLEIENKLREAGADQVKTIPPAE